MEVIDRPLPAHGKEAFDTGLRMGAEQEPEPSPNFTLEENEKQVFQAQADSPPCPECGAMMVRNASCYKCLNCGASNGCS